MHEENQAYITKWSKRAAGFAALGLTFGLAWAVSSGFKSPPAEVVTSHSMVQLAWPYRGMCGELALYRGPEPMELSSSDVRGGLARLSFALTPGTHELTVRFQTPVPGLAREYPLTVTIDQQAPGLTAFINELELGSKNMVTVEEGLLLAGQTEPGVRLHLEGRELAVDAQGKFESPVDLSPGWNHLLLVASDAAGNSTKLTHSLFRDVREPELVWHTRPEEIFKQKSARLEFELRDDGKIAGVSGKVDKGEPITFSAKGNGRWTATTTELHEGFHNVTVKAVDESGRVVASSRQIVVDSSEKLGEAALGLGARGADVTLLHQRLVDAGFLEKGAFGDVYDHKTESAVKKFQQSEGFEVTGVTEGETLAALGPRIFINLGNFSLVLDQPGQEPKRWTIASGSGEHPTPRGRFTIVEKVTDPTWLPPKSDWAKDAKPVPPGPDNPLGSRWLGFDWGEVGIHGTNAPWTVGSAASHGCMRMVTEEVEELFDLVEVGTPVVVLGGWEEEDPLLERYWPTKKPDTEEETAKN